jgi:hypothetical protein
VKLQEVDTIQDLREWVKENMPGARLTEDSAGDIVIHTGLVSTMGGYLHERGGDSVSTCMGCLKDFEDGDLVWKNGLVCADCNEGGGDD